jgi:transcriptional regulator with XRE-family HTH domain
VATPREQLGDALKQARVDAGYASHAQLAEVLLVSRPVVSRAENHREPVPRDDLIRAWAAATNVDYAQLIDYAKRARSPQNEFVKWADDFEQRATMIRWFELSLVPGLLQTENYARATFTWKPNSADAETNLRERLARQSIVERAELRVLILSSVLDREVGDASVMAEQIVHLVHLGSRPSIMIQIVPDVPEVAGALGGAFAISTEGTAETAAYSGSLINGTVHTDPDLIARAVRAFDGLRADALPWTQTRDVLTEVGERWKARI